MKAEVRRARRYKEQETSEGCFILEVANDGGDQVSIARARVPPGRTTEWHRLAGIQERYVIISGAGRVELEPSIVQDVSAGDVVRIPAGVGQRITNTGSGDLVFYCVCTPRFRQDGYEAIKKAR